MMNLRHTTKLALTITSTAVLMACSTPYERPAINLPSAYAHAALTTNANAVGKPAMPDRWWQSFNDPQLNALVDKVLANNNDLATAGVRLHQAQLRSGIQGINQFPRASGSIGSTVPQNAPNTFNANVSISYEADLWGRLASATKAAQWESLATAEDLESTALSLVASTCETYWRIAYTRQQINVGEQSLAYQRQVLELVQIQKRAGAVSALEVAEAEQNVQTQSASLSTLRQQLVEYRATLSLLMNGDAWSQENELTALPSQALPDVAPGLPAEILSRRPDVKASELRLRSTLATYDVTRTSYYPTLSLTGSEGGSSPQLKNVLKNTSASLLASLSLPFLNYPQNKLNTDLAKKDYDVAVINFRQSLLQALSDADNALSNRQQLIERSQSLYLALDAAQRVEQLYAIRYRLGKVSLRTWLDAQQSVRNVRLNYDNNQLSALINQSTLFKALGGRTDSAQIKTAI
jgi:NodT family efflux transporter outer membrane factor (OMF) lipoprotein